MKTPHTSCFRGKRVIVTLRSGKRLLDKFIERTHNAVRLQEHGTIPTVKIRAFTIYRGQPS